MGVYQWAKGRVKKEGDGEKADERGPAVVRQSV